VPHLSERSVAHVLSATVTHLMSNGASPTEIYENLVLAVATFIAGSNGSPVDHKFACDQFHERLLVETPKARHRFSQIARQSGTA
jgi:hypothetical protein